MNTQTKENLKDDMINYFGNSINAEEIKEKYNLNIEKEKLVILLDEAADEFYAIEVSEEGPTSKEDDELDQVIENALISIQINCGGL